MGVQALPHGAQYQTLKVTNHRPLESIAHLSEILPEKADGDNLIASVKSNRNNRHDVRGKLLENK